MAYGFSGPESVYGRSYRGESIDVDGKRFDRCMFENVTFMYHALAPTEFVECKFTGSFYLKTDNDGVKAFMAMVEQMRQMPHISFFKVGVVDSQGNISQIAPTVPIDQPKPPTKE